MRPMIQFIKENNDGSKLTGVEIGVFDGKNAESILQILSIKKLYLVDPYQYYTVLGELRDYLSHFSEAKARLKEYQDKIEFVRKRSDEAHLSIPNNLDFVYIDGNHNYIYARKDIKLYHPKLRDGGIIGGHDYTSHWGIKLAVDIFTFLNGCKLNRGEKDWWIVK